MARETYHHGDLKRTLITAGIEILCSSGVAGFSIRKVAQKAGVSHTAPYAHFKDKRALIAAIMTEGYAQLHRRMVTALEGVGSDSKRGLIEAAWAYVDFALSETELFTILFSGILEEEKEFPSYIEMTGKCYSLLSEMVRACQAAGILASEPEEIAATRIWSCLHGFASLVANGQISHVVLDRMKLRDLVAALVLPRAFNTCP